MCMAYSNGMDVLLFSQEEEEKQKEKQTQQPNWQQNGGQWPKSPLARASGASE